MTMTHCCCHGSQAERQGLGALVFKRGRERRYVALRNAGLFRDFHIRCLSHVRKPCTIVPIVKIGDFAGV